MTGKEMNKRMVWSFRGVGLILLTMLSGCVVQPLTKRGKGEVWQRTDVGTPQLLVRAFYGTPEEVQALLAELGDVVRPVRRWARQGNGAVSMRFVDERGQALRTVESGGHLIVEGQPGQAYAIRVRNETDVILEVLPMVDGLDLESGLAADLGKAGKRVGPRKEVVFGSRGTEGGKAEALRFRKNEGAAALHRWSPTGTAGSVLVAVFVGQGDDSFDDMPARERQRAVAVGNQGTFPQPSAEPMRLPYQYR
jgi:hypothetical protein